MKDKNLKKLITLFRNQTCLQETGKSDTGKSIMKLGQKTLFSLKEIIKIIESLEKK